jgi:hypothetical protein
VFDYTWKYDSEPAVLTHQSGICTTGTGNRQFGKTGPGSNTKFHVLFLCGTGTKTIPIYFSEVELGILQHCIIPRPNDMTLLTT